mgnify:CR=1 FL=1
MKCVVTGASGHIGNVLVRELIKNGYEVKAFVLENENVEYLKELQIEICYGDVRNIESLEKAFQGAEIVFHLAGIIDIGTTKRKTIYSVNVEGTKNVLQACKKEKVKKLVYTSSVHAIAEKPIGEVITETIDCANKKIGAYLEGGYNFVDVRDVAKGIMQAAQKR